MSVKNSSHLGQKVATGSTCGVACYDYFLPGWLEFFTDTPRFQFYHCVPQVTSISQISPLEVLVTYLWCNFSQTVRQNAKSSLGYVLLGAGRHISKPFQDNYCLKLGTCHYHSVLNLNLLPWLHFVYTCHSNVWRIFEWFDKMQVDIVSGVWSHFMCKFTGKFIEKKHTIANSKCISQEHVPNAA